MGLVEPGSSIAPLVSVAMLVKNERTCLPAVLAALMGQQAPFPFEIVVVDDGSTDGTRELLASFPVRLFCIEPENFAFGPIRDFAFEQTRGSYIVTLSGDALPASDQWLAAIIAPLQQGFDVAQGMAVPPPDRRCFYWERAFYYTSDGREFYHKHGGVWLSCVSLAIRRDAWADTRFGDAIMAEDKAIQCRLATGGYRMTFANDAIVYHAHDYTLRSLKRRCEAEGFGWRPLGVRYSFWQLLRDLCRPRVMALWLRGLVRGELRGLPELLFPLVRPLYLFKGNRLTSSERVRRHFIQHSRPPVTVREG